MMLQWAGSDRELNSIVAVVVVVAIVRRAWASFIPLFRARSVPARRSIYGPRPLHSRC